MVEETKDHEGLEVAEGEQMLVNESDLDSKKGGD